MNTAPPGSPNAATQAAELHYWDTHGLREWPLLARRYRHIFPLESIDYATASVMDVGSGPISVLEYFAPPSADVVPYDPLADAYNQLVPTKRFAIRREFPQRPFSHIIMFNALDHMDDPGGLLEQLAAHLAPDGQLWIFTNINRPYAPEEHPQDFRFWQLTTLVQRWFDLERAWIHCDGLLFPYAWCGIARPKSERRLQRAGRALVTNVSCALTLTRYYAIRAGVKAVKLVGLRELLPKPLQF